MDWRDSELFTFASPKVLCKKAFAAAKSAFAKVTSGGKGKKVATIPEDEEEEEAEEGDDDRRVAEKESGPKRDYHKVRMLLVLRMIVSQRGASALRKVRRLFRLGLRADKLQPAERTRSASAERQHVPGLQPRPPW